MNLQFMDKFYFWINVQLLEKLCTRSEFYEKNLLKNVFGFKNEVKSIQILGYKDGLTVSMQLTEEIVKTVHLPQTPTVKNSNEWAIYG